MNDDHLLTVTSPSDSYPGGVQWAVSFTMPSSDYEMSSVTLRLLIGSGADPDVTLWNDNGGSGPGTTQITTFIDPPVGPPIADFNFVPTSPVTLQADHKYWLLVDTQKDFFPFTWVGSNPGILPTGAAAFSGDFYSLNNGVSYISNASTIPSLFFTGTFRIEGEAITSVPEGGSLTGWFALVMVGLTGSRTRFLSRV